jgi:hypothetical protein
VNFEFPNEPASGLSFFPLYLRSGLIVLPHLAAIETEADI